MFLNQDVPNMPFLLITNIFILECVGVKDFTIQTGGRGCYVANSVIQRIENSMIFKPNNFMLARIAMTLDYGKNNSYFSSYGRGLFRVTPLMFTNAGNAANFLGLSEVIRKHFCFEIENLRYEDMDEPMKAGVAVMLLLERKERIPYQHEIKLQAILAAELYDYAIDDAFISNFQYQSMLLNFTGFSSCITNCNPQPADITFAIDMSANIPSQDLYKTAIFINNYITLLRTYKGIGGADFIKFAIILFNSGTLTISAQKLQMIEMKIGPNSDASFWNDYIYSLLHDSHLQNVTDYGRCVEKVFGQAIPLFQNITNGFRAGDSEIAQKLVIFTSGEPDNLTKVEEEHALFNIQLPQVSVFAVGMHSNATKSSLNVISGSPLTSLAYRSFDDFQKDDKQVADMLCRGLAYMPLKVGNETTNGPDYDNSNYHYESEMNLTYMFINRWKYFTLNYDSGSLISMKFRFQSQIIDGARFALHVFFGFGNNFPTAILNDFFLKVEENETKTILIRPNRDVLLDVCDNTGKETENWTGSATAENKLMVAIMPTVNFTDEGVDKNYDYLEGVYELFNLTRDQDISLPGENLPESLQDYWAIIETIIAGTGAKGIGLDLNEYGEEIVKPAACQQILCRNFIEYVEVKVIAKDASPLFFKDYEDIFNGLLVPNTKDFHESQKRLGKIDRTTRIQSDASAIISFLMAMRYYWCHNPFSLHC